MTETAGYLKAGFQGFQGTGKTHTAMELAMGAREHFKLDGPIAMFDTEAGANYWSARVKARTGKPMLAEQARSLEALMAFGRACLDQGVAVAVVDSVTHVWRELCDSYLAEVNAARKERRKPPLTKLEFQHWNPIKAAWARWADFYLNAPLHIVICGRAGYEYDFEENEEGKKELVKTGIKMKAEGEFGFEPSLLVEMESVQVLAGKKHKIIRRATVLKDRFGVVDGKQCDSPTFKFFAPHVKLLSPAEHTQIDTTSRTEFGVDESGDAAWQQERRERKILAEEIQGELVSAFPGQTSAEKKQKADLLAKHFGTRSWEAIENRTPATRLRIGLDALRRELGTAPVLVDPHPADDVPADFAASDAPAGQGALPGMGAGLHRRG
jgi:hypothetical protein